MFLLKWIKWIRNKLASDTVKTMETPDMAMIKVRQFLEDVDLVPTEIIVTLFNDSIELSLGGKVEVKYVDRGDYCTVEWNTLTSKYHRNFLDVFSNEFCAILQISKPSLRYLEILIDDYHLSRTTRKLFWIRSRAKKYRRSGVPDKTMLKLFANYQKIMNFFDAHPMEIKSLKITGLGDSQLSNILSKIKTEDLSILTTVGGAKSFDFKEIVKLENWKSVNCLTVRPNTKAHPVTLFFDKPALFIGIDKISSDEICLIIKTFRKNPSMEEWHLNFDEHFDVMDLLVKEFGQPSQKNEWYFNVPGSEEVLNVSIWSKGTIDFNKLDRDEIPEGVVIH